MNIDYGKGIYKKDTKETITTWERLIAILESEPEGDQVLSTDGYGNLFLEKFYLPY